MYNTKIKGGVMIYKFYSWIVSVFDSMNQTQSLFFAYGFFLIMLLPLPVWTTLSSHMAGKKGRSPAGWFSIAIFLNFLTPIILLFVPKRKDFIKPSKCLYNWTCPNCWHSNDEYSTACEKCGAEKPKTHAE
jgi:hypothetical protein